MKRMESYVNFKNDEKKIHNESQPKYNLIIVKEKKIMEKPNKKKSKQFKSSEKPTFIERHSRNCEAQFIVYF